MFPIKTRLNGIFLTRTQGLIRNIPRRTFWVYHSPLLNTEAKNASDASPEGNEPKPDDRAPDSDKLMAGTEYENMTEESVKEHMIFGDIFEKMQREEKMVNENLSKFVHTAQTASSRATTDIRDNRKELKVSFGKTDMSEEIDPSDLKLVEYFKKLDEKTQDDVNSGSDGKDTELNSEPSSGRSPIMYDLFENIENTLVQNRKQALEQSEALRMNLAYPRPYPKMSKSFGLKIDVGKLEAEERYKIALETTMEPYINWLSTQLKTDYDMLEYVKSAIQEFLTRDRSYDKALSMKPIQMMEIVKKNCETTPTKLPQPYVITLPYVITTLLRSPLFDIPPERKYTIATYVFQRCKQTTDLSLYINVCNVDFYNLLLRLSWENFGQLHTLSKITSEMNINGVTGDIHTVELLDGIVKGIKKANDNEDIPDEAYLLEMQSQRDSNDTGASTPSKFPLSKGGKIDLAKLEGYLKNLKVTLTSGI